MKKITTITPSSIRSALLILIGLFTLGGCVTDSTNASYSSNASSTSPSYQAAQQMEQDMEEEQNDQMQPMLTQPR